jgi:hypothetical protein
LNNNNNNNNHNNNNNSNNNNNNNDNSNNNKDAFTRPWALCGVAVDPAPPKGAPRLSTPETAHNRWSRANSREFNGKGGNRLWRDGQNPLAFMWPEASIGGA